MNYRFTMDAAHAIMLLDPRRAQMERWRTGSIYPDSTGRIRHLDETADKLESEMRNLEDMRYLERDEDKH